MAVQCWFEAGSGTTSFEDKKNKQRSFQMRLS
jgi:hypothetical protein